MWKAARGPCRGNAGVAYVLAMLYLLLFSVLAIGFFAACTMSTQLSRNDRLAAEAQAAAESGVEFVRYQLGQVTLGAQSPDTRIIDAIADELGRQMNGTPNMRGHAVFADGGIIFLPADNDCILLDPGLGTRFAAQITTSGPAIWVKVIGRSQGDAIARGDSTTIQACPV